MRPAEFEDEGCVLRWFILRLLALIIWSKVQLLGHSRSGRVSIVCKGSRMSSQAVIYSSDAALGSTALVGVLLVFFQLRALEFHSGTYLVQTSHGKRKTTTMMTLIGAPANLVQSSEATHPCPWSCLRIAGYSGSSPCVGHACCCASICRDRYGWMTMPARLGV